MCIRDRCHGVGCVYRGEGYLKKKSCAYAAMMVGAGGVIYTQSANPVMGNLLGMHLLFPTKEEVYCIGDCCIENCENSNPKWGLFRKSGKAHKKGGEGFYKHSSFKWYIEGSVEELPSDKGLSAVCYQIESLGDWLGDVLGFIDKTSMSGIAVRPVKSKTNEGEQNYCYYGGESSTAMLQKAGVTAAIIAIEAGLTYITGGAWLIVAQFGLGATEAWAYELIDQSYYWPHNPSLPSG